MPAGFTPHNDLMIRPDYLDAFRAAGLDRLQHLLDTPGEAVMTKNGLGAWRQRVVLSVNGQRLYLKRYRRPPLGEQLHQRIRGFASTAAVEWHWLDQMRRLGIGCPQPVAFGQQCRLGLESASAIVTAAVPGTSLEHWVRSDAAASLRDPSLRRRLILHLADLTRTIHQAGLYHRDLYLSHMFLSLASAPRDAMDVALIDLQRMIRPFVRHHRWRIKDLASMNYSTPADVASKADRLRFFRSYAGKTDLSWWDRFCLRLVVAKTQRIARHSRKHQLG